MKYFLISISVTSILFFSGSPLLVHAQAIEPPSGTFNNAQPFAENDGFVPLTGVPGLTDSTEDRTLVDYLNVIFRFAIGIGALAAVLRITFAGIMYMTSEASHANKSKAIDILTNSVLGLLLLLSIVVILQVVNKDILDLNFLSQAQRLPPSTAQIGGNAEDGQENNTPDEPAQFCQFRGERVEKSVAENKCGENGDFRIRSGSLSTKICSCDSSDPVETNEPTNQEELTEEEQSFFDAVVANDSNLRLSNSDEVKEAIGDKKVIFSVDREAHGRAGISPNTVKTTCEKSGGEFEAIGNPPKGFLCLE